MTNAPSRDAALRDLERVREERTALEARAVRGVADARQAGATWTSIGNALGVTRQAAQERYGRATA